MANSFDFASWITRTRSKIVLPSLILTVVFILIALFLGAGYWLLVPLPLALLVFMYGFYVIPETDRGYKVVLGKMDNKTFEPGWGWVIPFLGSMTNVNVQEQKYSCTIDVDDKNTIQFHMTFQLNWKLNRKNIHLLHQEVGEDRYIDVLIVSQLQAAATRITSCMDSNDVKNQKSSIEKSILEEFDKLYDKDYFNVTRFSLWNVDLDSEYAATLKQKQLAEKKQAAIVVELATERLKAENDKTIQGLKGEGDATYYKVVKEAEAEGIKRTGEAENDVLERRGKVLRDNPSIIRERQAEHTPKVLVNGNGGGIMPTVSVDPFIDHELINK